MTELTNLLSQQHLTQIFLVVVTALVAMKFLVGLWDYFRDRYEIETKTTRREKAQTQAINEMKQEINVVKQDQEEIKENLRNLSSAVTKMQEKQDASTRARLKDRLTASRSYYINRNTGWSHLEKEAFMDLIRSYQEVGGNGIISSVIEPWAIEWPINDEHIPSC